MNKKSEKNEEFDLYEDRMCPAAKMVIDDTLCIEFRMVLGGLIRLDSQEELKEALKINGMTKKEASDACDKCKYCC